MYFWYCPPQQCVCKTYFKSKSSNNHTFKSNIPLTSNFIRDATKQTINEMKYVMLPPAVHQVAVDPHTFGTQDHYYVLYMDKNLKAY